MTEEVADVSSWIKWVYKESKGTGESESKEQKGKVGFKEPKSKGESESKQPKGKEWSKESKGKGESEFE